MWALLVGVSRGLAWAVGASGELPVAWEVGTALLRVGIELWGGSRALFFLFCLWGPRSTFLWVSRAWEKPMIEWTVLHFFFFNFILLA